MISFVFIIVICSLFFIPYKIYKKHRVLRESLPPGPPSLPLVGSLTFLQNTRGFADAIVQQQLYHYHPKLCTVWIGLSPIIVIQDFNLARDLFSREDFSARPAHYHAKYIRGLDGESLGIIATKGKFWQEQRRFTLKSLKDLGFGRNKLDYIIHEEVNILIEDLISRSGTGDVLMGDIFNFPIVNILWQIVASKRYDPNLPESKSMMRDVGIVFHEGISMINFFIHSPFLRSFIPLKKERAELGLKRLFRQQIIEHEIELDLNESHEAKDFIDMYLKEIKRQYVDTKYNIHGKYQNFNIEQLVTICLDFFQAGSETSSTTLSWAIMLLTLYPDVQEKCREEINLILGGRKNIEICIARIYQIDLKRDR